VYIVLVDYKSKEIPEEVLDQIFNLRVKINQVFFETGPANIEFIKLSQELEVLLNRYQKIDINGLLEDIYLKNNKHTAKELVQQIEVLRYELIQVGLMKGLNHESTLKISKQLDSYIAKYQNL
jgi:hypothetical protein